MIEGKTFVGALVLIAGLAAGAPLALAHGNVTPQAVDTTGAGDIFNGALAVALGEDQPLLQAVRFANAAAAISVTRRGAQLSAPTRRQIDRMLRHP